MSIKSLVRIRKNRRSRAEAARKKVRAQRQDKQNQQMY
jgi:hypothetical protein